MSPTDKPIEAFDDDDDVFALEKLLAAAEADEAAKPTQPTPAPPNPVANAAPRLIEDSSFAEAFSYDIDSTILTNAPPVSALRNDEMDSSDDEEVKNFLERKYNEYGRDINKNLKKQNEAHHEAKVTREVAQAINSNTTKMNSVAFPGNPFQQKTTRQTSQSFKNPSKTDNQTPPSTSLITNYMKPVIATSVFTDPVFGLKLINPLVSSTGLKERMSGKTPIPFSTLAFHTQRGDLSKDWVIGAVLVSKSPVKTTKKGGHYSIWKLSDLKGDMKLVSLFMFNGAHKHLWKTATGMAVAILNPNCLDKRAESGDIACLSIDTDSKVMILGQSKDLGTCKAKKKNGDPCTATVNLGDCDYCVFHMKQEYSKMSSRSELQSSTSGRGLNELRNKVLGKSEVFYAGQSFMAVPAKRNAKLAAKDSQRLIGLSEYAVSPNAASVNHASEPRTTQAVPYAARGGPVSKLASNVESNRKQRLKDIERLKILQEESAKFSSLNASDAASTPAKIGTASSSKPSTPTTSSVSEQFKNRELSFSERSPSNATDVVCTPAKAGTPTQSAFSSTPRTSSVSKQFKNRELSFSERSASNATNVVCTPAKAGTTAQSASISKPFTPTTTSVPEQFKDRSFSFATGTPKLSRENFCIEVTMGEKQAAISKLKAMQALKNKPISKANPNFIKHRGTTDGKKRAIDELNDKFCSESKRQKIDEDQREIDRKTRIQRIMEATSSHTNLIESRALQEQDKYFNKLEKKEALEEKMLNTFKVPCKAVICVDCKYTAFSAADRCKEERHKLKIIDTEKRFFQCKDCGNRTATVHKLPKMSCKNCHGSRWERTAMIRERKIDDGREMLSIRGDEEMFMGTLASKANLNLLVPE